MISKLYQGLVAGFAIGFISYHFFRSIIPRKVMRSSIFKGCKYIMIVRTDINFGKAETAKNCCSVTLESYRRSLEETPEFVKNWERCGQPKITVKLDKNFEIETLELKKKAEELGLVAVVQTNKEGLITVVGIGPGPQDLVNQVTGHLKLLG